MCALTCAGEAEEDGYEDEYQLEDIDIGASTYIKPAPLPNFRRAWEECNPESELSDDYGLGQRDSLQVGLCICALLSGPPTMPTCPSHVSEHLHADTLC